MLFINVLAIIKNGSTFQPLRARFICIQEMRENQGSSPDSGRFRE